jgi:hypothetical protein
VQRYLWIALVLAACAKSAKDPGPTSSSSDTASQSTQSTPPVGGGQPSPPPPLGDPGDTGADKTALDHARSGASLGVSADTDAFEPLPGAGTVAEGGKQPPRPDRKVEPKGADGKPAAIQATIDAVTVDGKAAPAALAQALKVRVSDVQACYDKVGKPGLAGTLEISFAVLPTGALTTASVQATSLKNMAVESCVIGVIGAIKLAKPLGPTETKATVAIKFAAS